MTNLHWPPIMDRAREIVVEYDTPVTLRQLFYRLVAEGLVPNVKSKYQYLSSLTAQGRRDGTFPDLTGTSRIERPRSFSSPENARRWLRDYYRRDRTEGQPWTIYLGVEKAGLSAQLANWFSNPLGIPRIALGGYASQALCGLVVNDVRDQDRRAVLIYAGDLDPSGEDIDRDLVARTDVWDKVIRIALSEDQIAGLPRSFESEDVMAKLEDDPRAKKFVERHPALGLVQYELDALPPDQLRDLYQTEIDRFWDQAAYEAVLAQEDEDRGEL